MNIFQRLSYTALNFPTSAAGMPMFIFILPFYADDLGLGLSVVGIIFFLGRFIDILTDPIMGVLIDRFPSRWGKHKLWIFLSTPVFMIAIYLIFLPSIEQASILYFFTGLFFIYVAFTLSSITQLSWSSFLAPNYDGDSHWDGADIDDDNDGILDTADSCSKGALGWTSYSFTDHDMDGCMDSIEDIDDDNDGVSDFTDSCRIGALNWVSSGVSDYDSDGCRDSTEDTDDDNDGISDSSDSCSKGTLTSIPSSLNGPLTIKTKISSSHEKEMFP